MTDLVARFARNLKSTRTRRMLSQGDLAKKTRLSPSYLSMLERGLRSPPLATIQLLATALKTTASRLFER